jgi:hypothetical protein
MRGSTGFKFKARIRLGAPIGHDFGYFKWPECKGTGGGEWKAADPDMWFECEIMGDDRYECCAPGYGEKPYGNGSLFVYGLKWLDVLPEDRARIIDHMKASKTKQITAAVKQIAKLQTEMDGIQ